MGQALYRKYRSKSLNEIIGQEHITNTLANAIKTGKISHAYLFTGPRGVGKTSIARILAHEVNGLPYTDESIHLDIIEIDAASNRRIDEIRDLRDKVHIAPTSAKYKVYIIDEVHMLTKEAFNALLKTLEEPPAHVIFILATTDAHKLPDTIISRTQRYSFRPVPVPKVAAHLRELADKEGMKIDDSALELLAEHGEGSFRDSISLLDQVGHSKKAVTRADVERLIGVAPDEIIESLLSAALNGTPAQIAAGLDALTEQGITAQRTAKQLAANLRTQILAGETSSKEALQLIEQLLEVPAAHNPAAMLELALFSANLTGSFAAAPNLAPAPAPPEKPVKAAKETEDEPPHKEEPAPVAAEESQSKSKPSNGEDISGWWPKLLDEVKKHNNTLYGVLRMGQPALEKGMLTLSFAFGFHAKKIADAKTTGTLQKLISDITGSTLQITAVHNKSLKGGTTAVKTVQESTPEPLKSAAEESEDLRAITSIFGGGEVLES